MSRQVLNKIGKIKGFFSYMTSFTLNEKLGLLGVVECTLLGKDSGYGFGTGLDSDFGFCL